MLNRIVDNYMARPIEYITTLCFECDGDGKIYFYDYEELENWLGKNMPINCWFETYLEWVNNDNYITCTECNGSGKFVEKR